MWVKHPALKLQVLDSQNARHILGCLLLLLLIVFSLDRKPQRVQWNKWIMYPMIVCGLWMLIISFFHPVGDGYRAFALLLIIGYPCLYFVWNNRGDYDKLFNSLARALAVIGLIVFVYCLYLSIQGDFVIIGDRSAGLLTNTNLFSITGLFGSSGALYMLIKNSRYWRSYLFYSVSLGCDYAIVLMGGSRTSVLACIACLIVTVFFYLRYCEKRENVTRIVKILSTVNIVIIIVVMSHICVDIQKTIDAKEISGTVTTEEITPNVSVVDRFAVSSEDSVDSYSSGRFYIWKQYSKHFNLTGNDVSQTDWKELTPNGEKKAHNNFFEMAYRFGVPMGILFIFLEIIVSFKALQWLFINRTRQIMFLMPILLTVLFLFMSMLDIATLPFDRDAPCYFYLALIPMVDLRYAEKITTRF